MTDHIIECIDKVTQFHPYASVMRPSEVKTHYVHKAKFWEKPQKLKKFANYSLLNIFLNICAGEMYKNKGSVLI